MTIKAIREFDWNRKMVLCWIKDSGQDRIEWIPMEFVYVNTRAKQ
mgnify:CR=1 FL=1